MSSFNNEITAIVFSDVHLGAWYNFHKDFLNFLKKIKEAVENNTLSSLKVIFITGDFLDLLMESSQNLIIDEFYNEMYSILNALFDRGIQIILVIGNHEIPSLRCFSKRKKEFITLFKNNSAGSLNLSFFDNEHLCLYAIFENSKRTSPSCRSGSGENESSHIAKIKLYNGKRALRRDKPFHCISLGHISETEFTMLLAHGHQFIALITKISAWLVWNRLIRADPADKDIIDFIWNLLPCHPDKESLIKAIQEIDSEDPEHLKEQALDWIAKNSSKVSKIISLFKRYQKHYKRINYVDEHMKKNILKFCRKLKKHNLSHVIFGHTHRHWIDDESSSYTITNVGSWQFPKDVDNNKRQCPYFLTISKDGVFTLERFGNCKPNC